MVVYDSANASCFMHFINNLWTIFSRLLLDYGADVNLPCGLTDADVISVDGARCVGSGALNEACKANCLPLVQLLLQRNAADHDNVALAIAVNVCLLHNLGSLAILFDYCLNYLFDWLVFVCSFFWENLVSRTTTRFLFDYFCRAWFSLIQNTESVGEVLTSDS